MVYNTRIGKFQTGVGMTSPKGSHYEVLDGLRGVAALSVVAFHIAEVATPDLAHNPLRHTALAVDFFFALSGFVMSHAYDQRLPASATPALKLTLAGFLVRRLIRLHPMVLVGMTLGVLSFLFDPFVRTPVDLPTIWPKLLLVYALSLLLLPEPCLPHRFGETHSLDAPAWSLFQEYIGNIFYGLVIYRLSRRFLFVLCIVSAIILVATVWRFDHIGQGWGLDNWWMGSVRLAYPFLSGILVHRLAWRVRMPAAFVWLSLILVAIFAAPLFNPFNSIAEAICVIFIFPAILCCGAGQTTVAGFMGVFCRFSGRLSYPLYMIHYPAIYIFAHWLFMIHPSASTIWPVAIGLYIGFVVSAYLTVKYYEEPVRAYLASRILRPNSARPTAEEFRPEPLG